MAVSLLLLCISPLVSFFPLPLTVCFIFSSFSRNVATRWRDDTGSSTQQQQSTNDNTIPQQLPATLADRYAHLDYGLDGTVSCRTRNGASHSSSNNHTNSPTVPTDVPGTTASAILWKEEDAPTLVLFSSSSAVAADADAACRAGSEAAQSMASWSNGAASLLTLFLNPVLLSRSDSSSNSANRCCFMFGRTGRKPILLLSLLLSVVPAAAFCRVQSGAQVRPTVYYVTSACTGAANYLAVAFASLADVIPQHQRTAAYGTVLAGFYGGLALGPLLGLALERQRGGGGHHDHDNERAVGFFSLTCCLLALLLAAVALPETLAVAAAVPPSAEPLPAAEARLPPLLQQQQKKWPAEEEHGQPPVGHWPESGSNDNAIDRHDDADDDGPPVEGESPLGTEAAGPPFVPSVSSPSSSLRLLRFVAAPFREISILNRNRSIRLVAIGSFFAAAVFAADHTLVIYYVEEQFQLQQRDIASMMLAMGLAGIVLQAGALPPLVGALSERGLLVVTFACGTLHNALYGLSRSTAGICAALLLSQLTKLNFPLLSSLASSSVEEHEQGRVQGALFATNAVASAIGPLSMEWLYRWTKNNNNTTAAHVVGPGVMFLFAAGLYAIGTMVVCFIPKTTTTLGEDGRPRTRIDGETTNIAPASLGMLYEEETWMDLHEPLLLMAGSNES
jgi:Major Facilitator Superfamily